MDTTCEWCDEPATQRVTVVTSTGWSAVWEAGRAFPECEAHATLEPGALRWPGIVCIRFDRIPS